MATYAAVVSVMHLMEQIQSYQVRHSIFSDKQQRQLDSLAKKVSFLQDFLESFFYDDSDEAESLASRIVDVAYDTEDVIESYIVDDIHHRENRKQSKISETKINHGGSATRTKIIANKFSQDIQKIIELVDSIKREILDIKDTNKVRNGSRLEEPDQTGSSGVLLNIEKNNVVGFDDISNSIMEKITLKESKLHVLSINGMGGSGKSTLAKKIYDDRFVNQRFDICGWVTVSEAFNAVKVLSELLRDTGFPMHEIRKENFVYEKLGENLHKHLSGRKFFVIIDDIWSLEAWDKIKLFLQDSNNGSRILVTTRLTNLANDIGSFPTFKMQLLDDTQSWNLLCRKVFGSESCPLELEEVGKVVAGNCRGLPLSIVVTGGLLRKLIKREYWEYIAENTNASVNLDENERCLKILYMSYNHLPIHLKPCFLYLGVYPEDHEIRVNQLVLLLVAERFLKPNKAKSLEEVAMDYVKDLIDRNLIFVTRLGSIGKVKRCKVHDLLRDLCLREATKKRFLYASQVPKLEISKGSNSHRRIVFCGDIPYKEDSPLTFDVPQSSSIRSFIYDSEGPPQPSDVKLLSVLNLYMGVFPLTVVSKLVNTRYIKLGALFFVPFDLFTSSVYRFWNLQMLIMIGHDICFPSELWEMSHLRHVIINAFTVDDPCAWKSDGEQTVVLENLQTFTGLYNFRCSEEVLCKIPNVKKLSVTYNDDDFPSDYLKNLGRLTRLESLNCVVNDFYMDSGISAFEFPVSLKKLSLRTDYWDWNGIGEKIGLLPNLEKLTLNYELEGEEWNLVEGQFACLKYLSLTGGLTRWTAESSPFPCLEHLRLQNLVNLEEIPYEIGDIPTLRSIEVTVCSSSAADSAEMIREEQINLGNEELLVTVRRNY